MNGEAERLFGRTRHELLDRPVAEALALRLPDGELVLEADWHPSVRLRSVRRAPERLLIAPTPAGDVPLRATAVYERGADGRFTGAVISLRPGQGPAGDAAGAEIIATLSHELRWPLTSVKGYTSLLLNRWDRLPDDQRRLMLGHIDAATDRIVRLITELLDVARLENRRVDLHRGPVDLPSLVSHVVARIQVTHPELRCSIEFPVRFPYVLADSDKIEQVLTNLVENALEHAGADVRICGEVVEDVAVVSVQDRGEGIPASELSAIFGRFTGRARRAGGRDGTGLGLWISRRLVELHGGSLTATSIGGKGSTFRFTVPLAPPG